MAMQIKLERVAGLFSEGFADEGSGCAQSQLARRQARRRALLHETPLRRVLRLGQVLWRSLHPACLSTLAPTFGLVWREKTIAAQGLPDPDTALAKPDGLAGLARDLSPATLMAAYAKGLHPRCLAGPATFWAPTERLVAHPADLKLDAGLRSHLHQRNFEVALDHDFDNLVEACAVPGPGQPRLNPKLRKAHVELFDAAIAHSFVMRDSRGEAIGGGYGIATGRCFVIERWFGYPDAARFALAVLASHLTQWGFKMLDATPVAGLVEGMGFSMLARAAYNRALDAPTLVGRPGFWRTDPDIYSARSRSTAVRHLFDVPREAIYASGETLADADHELMLALAMDAPPRAPKASLPFQRAA